MKCAIVSVGTEILFGQITNTNSVYLSRQLNLLGFDVLYHYTVGDNDGRLSEILRFALNDCDMVFTTGGLGPTQDDMTKETVTHIFGDVLVEDEASMKNLKQKAKLWNNKMTPNNLKQAMMPSKAIVFANDTGSAPGFAVERNRKHIISMPGPPKEMTTMFENHILPWLERFRSDTIYYRVIRCFGIGESLLETKLLDIINNQTDPTIATYAKRGECTIRVASKRKTEDEAMESVNACVDDIVSRLSDYVFSTDDESLPQVVGKKLIENNISISCAESCTGGMFADELTSVAGISEVFDRGFVTYTERAKIDELNVCSQTIEENTVYSSEIAEEMAKGVYAVTGSRICISITGVAGPDAVSDDKPAGLAYIGVSVDGVTNIEEIRVRNVSRNSNRAYFTMHMFDLVNKTINKMLEERP